MQIQLFTISIFDNHIAQKEMNAFLKAHKILSVESELVSTNDGVWWCFCVRYLEPAVNAVPERKVKVDYRQVLDDATFQKFVHLRNIRKRVASEEGLSAFIVFTDEELAALAKLDEISVKSMLTIKGIGEKKVERFARYFITTSESDEAQREIS